jgi:short subunit dehydrogenase-like uncharacterized protein
VSDKNKVLIYGSYGYTGALVAQMAVKRGLKPVLAGRNPRRLEMQSAGLGLEGRVFPLDHPISIDKALQDVLLVAHCAGPFSQTAAPMAEACLRTGAHYLDITGELSVFESLAGLDQQARAAGIMILPGAGFDVVPSDCLAVHLKQALPTATHLHLAIRGLSRSSQGTAKTALERLGAPCVIRKAGSLTAVPAGSITRHVDFGAGPVTTSAIAWGDLVTAFHSTGIPNIETSMALPLKIQQLMRMSAALGPLAGSSALRRILQLAVRTQPPGPSEQQRLRGRAILWGEVRDDAGNTKQARLHTIEPYTLTALAVLAVCEKVNKGEAPTGFQTPAMAYGKDFIMEIDRSRLEEL